MKKQSIKSSVVCETILYVLYVVVGILMLMFPSFGISNQVFFISMIFLILAFFSFGLYFLNKKYSDYDMLYLSIINVAVGVYLYLFKNDTISSTLAVSCLVFSVSFLISRAYNIYLLYQKNNYIWLVKIITTVLICFLGSLTTTNLFKELTVPVLMMGYFYLAFGVVCILEPIFELFISDKKFSKYVENLLNEDEKKATKKVTKK